MRSKAILACGAALAVVLGAQSASADEGMWTFDNFPSALVKQKYGVVVDQAWLDRVRGATGRISGCSASIVSPNGLVLTNYHCVAGCVQDLTAPGHDYLADGFSATAAEEKRCPGETMEVLQSISDVSQRVLAAGEGKTGGERDKALGAAAAALEKEGCGSKPGYRCQVIAFYGASQYKLYTFRRYDDLRLVFTPEFKTAFFGGDPDNFNFPRYNLDFGLMRIYVDGKPASPPEHLRWNPVAPRPGEPIFVVGNPGGTERLRTISELETQRDLVLPFQVERAEEKRGRLIRFTEESGDNAHLGEEPLNSVENTFKVLEGRLDALDDHAFFRSKVDEETALRAKVAANPQLAKEIGDPWADMATVQGAVHDLYLPYYELESSPASPSSSALFRWARQIVRGAAERPKASGDRLPEFSDSRLPQVEHALFAEAPVIAPLEELNLEFWLSKTREALTVDDPVVKRMLGKESPENLAQRLVSGTKLGDPAVRKALWDGGSAAVAASDDPLIRFAVATDPDARDIRKQWEARVRAPSEQASQRIAKARFAIYGEKIYPDATFSPRITYGSVVGWVERGHDVYPVTDFGGFYDRATGQAPFELTPKWSAAKGRLDLKTPFDFSGSLDIIGGNSGSPTLNAQGDVIGAVFDGNIHSIGGDYGYDPRLNRSVSVTSAAIQEALLKVYDRADLVKELNSK
jgi:V8-like Glu-specific endopeptidase